MTYHDPSETSGIDTLIISTDDRTVFRCSPVLFGGPNAPYPVGQRLRWNLERLTAPPRDDKRQAWNFVGPPIQLNRSPDAVRELVNEWWEGKKALGQGNENAATMRARLVNEVQHPDHSGNPDDHT